MNGLLLILSLLALVGMILLVVRLKRFHSRQELLQERIRTSETYRCVRPLIERCRKLRVERIALRPEGVTVTLFDPPGKVLRCTFEEHGLDEVAPEPLQALAKAFAIELPMLADNQQYFCKIHREVAGDETLRWYEYMIQPAYKDSVLRQRYDKMESE